MTELKNIYLVTSGSHSDFGIEGAFSTPEKANEFLEKLKKAKIIRPVDIEVLEVDVPKEQWWKSTVWMDREGNIPEGLLGTGKMTYQEFNTYSIHGHNGMGFDKNKGLLRVTVWTNDKEKAVRVANEKRVKIIALGIWGNKEEIEKWSM